MTKKEKTPFIKKDIMELIDFKSMDKFAKKTKKVQVLQNTYQMSKILALVMKATIFRQDEFFNPILEYTENDVKLIQELIEWNTTSIENKTLNNFSANKNLATLYWMIGETDSMMKHARIAIRDFPIQKTTTSFDADDIFSVVLLSLKMQKNYPEFEQTLFSDIEATKIVNLSPIESHINLAKLNLYREDFEKCAEHLVIAKNIDENNLELNRVIIQYHLAMGNMDDFQAYINKCRDMEKTDVETGNLALQLGFYNLFVGDAQEAYNTLSIAKEKLEGCTLCDQMIEKYIEVGE
jgi:tetratricopeptide (TPR) repeat protein